MLVDSLLAGLIIVAFCEYELVESVGAFLLYSQAGEASGESIQLAHHGLLVYRLAEHHAHHTQLVVYVRELFAYLVHTYLDRGLVGQKIADLHYDIQLGNHSGAHDGKGRHQDKQSIAPLQQKTS